MSKHKFRGQAIDIPGAYKEGHTLTAEEAEALNRYRAELIMNRLRAAFDKTPDDKLTTDAVNAKLQEIVKSFTWSPSRTTDPVLKEARAIASEVVKNPKAAKLVEQMKANGFDPNNRASALEGIKAVDPATYQKIMKLANDNVNSMSALV